MSSENSLTKTKPQVHVVYGPTASGKTALAIQVAQELNGELINADSRQIYKGMDIGTNKGKLTAIADSDAYLMENSQIIGWLFNLVDPDSDFNVSDFQKLAYAKIADILARGKTPILVGGTGLYINAVVKSLDMQNVELNPKLRAELDSMSTQDLQLMLIDIDDSKFEAMNNSDQNNPRRLVRALEIVLGQKSQLSEMKDIAATNYEYIFKTPEWEREALFSKINTRVEEMFANGLVAETETLVSRGFKETRPLQSIGYKEVLQFLDQEISLEEAIALTKIAHRNYAKRQITWFKKFGQD